jgi:hypothetical protein
MRILFVISALLAFLATPAFAQSDAEGQQACGNDAFALCQQAIPDRGRIEACLRQNFRRASPACRSYMASYSRSHRATAPRHSRRHRTYRHHRTDRHHHVYRHHKKTHGHHHYSRR